MIWSWSSNTDCAAGYLSRDGIGAAMFRKLIGACVGLAMMGMAGTANALLKVFKIAFGVIALMAVALIHAGNATATLYYDGTPGADQELIEMSFLSDLGTTGITLGTEGFNVLADPAPTLVFGDVTATGNIFNVRTTDALTTEGTHSLVGQGITFSFSSVINAFAIDLLDFGDPLSDHAAKSLFITSCCCC